MNKVGATSGILICSGGFTRGVFDFARGLPIQLIDIDNLLQIVNKLTPQQIETVADISDKKFRAKNEIYEFKIVGELMILFSQLDVSDAKHMVHGERTSQKNIVCLKQRKRLKV